ncbi:primosomal protein N' [Enterobacteriaceae endosymbiont of Donacia thalassina]|uniref:replication restart helicase PriA n=1 Tax=Enterobacteriaceae endosymbiont of Donacia thalassina TaxID=2675786 RepID=UPI001448D398|nr:primosomal protein N' [Enterobacteriaceae endosymbiont of Donacia thalassina]QJC37488.1 primosomal protein N' [Enterobacteriaceae endosymbiont of Donacia thalassina]
MKIIKVVFNNSIICNKFDYLLSKNRSIYIGCRVIVPIKTKNYIGIVLEIHNFSKIPIKKLKFLYKILDKKPIFDPLIFDFAHKISTYYKYPIGFILFQILPIFFRKKNKYTKSLKNKLNLNNTKILNNNIKIIKSYNFKKIEDVNIENKKNFLLNTNILNIMYKTQNHKISNFFQEEYLQKKFSVWITQDNIIFLEKINIYLKIIKKIISEKKQVLIIVPQTYYFFYLYQFLISNLKILVCLLYSNFKNQKTLSIWDNIKNGKIKIIIGTKFTIFTQYLKLGLIILIEEHNFIYKKTNIYKYNVRDIAILRAKIENIPILLSSKTPSLETLHNINIKKFKFLFENNEQILYKNFFKFIILDMNKQISKLQIFSNILIKKIKICIKNNEQIIIYYKYQGYSNLILCFFCKKPLKCKDCNKNYVFYKKLWKLYCIYCKKSIIMLNFCPLCKNNFFIPIGIGTEQLIEFLKKLFSNILILNINNKNFLEKFLLIKNNKPSIIISSHILHKKYFYFSKNNLIIILNIDNVFFSKNFRATEYFSQYIFSILNNHLDIKKKTVIIQTYFPKNEIIIKIFKKYNTYYDISNFILKERKIMLLPPFTKHIILILESYNKKILLNFLNILKKKIISKYINEKNFFIIGPLSLIQNKRKGLFRKQIILQHIFKKKLQFIIKYIISIIEKIVNFNKIKLIINVDPI